MHLMVLIAAFAMIATPDTTGDWRLTAYSDGGASLIDASSVQQISASKRVAWGATVWSTTSENGVDYSLLRDEFDCLEETITNLELVAYNADGVSVMSDDTRQLPRHVVPGSTAEATLREVCAATLDLFAQSWPNVRAFLTYFRSPAFVPDL